MDGDEHAQLRVRCDSQVCRSGEFTLGESTSEHHLPARELREIIEAAVVVEDPRVVVCLVRELIAGYLGGHLAADGEDAASEAWDEMANVRIGAVDDMFGEDSASVCFDFVGSIWGS